MNIFMFIADVFCSKKWVCSHLFGCGKTNFEPLARGNVPNANQCIIASLSGRSGWPSYDKLGHWACPSTQEILCDKKAEEWGSLSRACKMGRVVLKLCRSLNVVVTGSELEPTSISSSSFLFWFRTFMKKTIMNAFKILK